MDRKMIMSIVLVLIIVSAGTFIVLSKDSNETAGPVTLVDAIGRNVTTAEAPARIISCSPSLTEIVYAMGLGDRLVAVTDYCDWPADVTARKDNGSLVTIGGYFTPSIEAIVEAEGDIILVDQGVSTQLDMVPLMEDMHLKFIVLYKGLTFEEVYQNIAMIGEICWAQESADQLIASMQDRLEAIQYTIGAMIEGPSVVFAVWLDPIFLSGNGTFSNEMMTMAMGENAYSDMTAWPVVGIGTLLERDPDYILVSMMYLSTPGEEILAELKNDTLWSALTAVQNDRVYIFTGQCDSVFTRPGPRFVDGVELMAKILHSDAFNVTMPNVIADDYVDWVSDAPSADAHEVEATVMSYSGIMAQVEVRRV